MTKRSSDALNDEPTATVREIQKIFLKLAVENKKNYFVLLF